MKQLSRLSLAPVFWALLFCAGCNSGNNQPPPGVTGGASARGGSAGNAGGGASGSGGNGTAATGGSTTTGGGGKSGGAGGAGGGTPGSGGRTATAGSNGAAGSGGGGSTGVAGRGGAGNGGSAGGGSPASGGAGGGGTSGNPAPGGDDFVSNVKVAVHAQTTTILVVTWSQLKAADTTALEFSYTGSDGMTSRPRPGVTGAHTDVVLGVPEKTTVTVRIVSKLAGVEYKTKDYQGTTGALPSQLPKPQVLAYDASLSSPEPWLLGSVENSPGGCDNPDCYYVSVFWIFIMDRQGRIVWYWSDPSDDASSAYPRVARDGEYLVIDRGRQGRTGVVKMTLDRQYYQFVSIPNLEDAMDVTSDGSVLYDLQGDLTELTKQGTTRLIWRCWKTFPSFKYCYSNTMNWNPTDDTIMMSFPDDGTVVQIDRKTGTMVGQYGNASGSYAFSPTGWKFQYPHSPNITPQGTLILSSHLPAYPDGTPAAPNHHAFEEFEIDRAGKKLTQKWIYSDGTEWAMYKGYAIRLANGNTLANYGTGGVLREITPDKKTVFHVKFPVTPGDGYDNKMLGNTIYITDLYALNGGGPK